MKIVYKKALLCVLLFSALNTGAIAENIMLNNPFKLNREDTLTTNFNKKISSFWKNTAVSDSFQGVANKRIYTTSIKNGNANAIVISQGRNESIFKYKELAFDLSQQGYDLYLIDHRGQGFSERFGGDSHRGHIEQFQDYVDDFNHYIVSLDLAKHYQQRYLLSHSMGGTISALYLQQYTHPFQASVFISPMFSINLGGISERIAQIITYSSAEICSWFNDKACYIFAGSGYNKEVFANNELTSSKIRFKSSINTFEQYPQAKLGSPTMRWVAESISATRQAVANASKINIPILIIQAGADAVVTPEGQNAFFKNITSCKSKRLINIAGAKHEILLESDRYRLPALTAALTFLQQSQQGKQECVK